VASDGFDRAIKRLHFLGDVEDYGAAFGCKRCGFNCATKTEMYQHRRGILSDCRQERIKQWVSDRVQ